MKIQTYGKNIINLTKKKDGRFKKEHRDFPELMKLGLRLHLINLDRYSREYELTPYSTRIVE